MTRSHLFGLNLLFCCLLLLPPLASSDLGPKIIVLSPQEGDTVTAPFDLDVRFMASADAHIVPDTLKVEVKKLLWAVDMTEHVKPFADAAGICMTQADLPKR